MRASCEIARTQPCSRSRTLSRGTLVFVGLAVLSVAVLPGCYQRVISVKGVGASAYQVEEPYAPYQQPKQQGSILKRGN